MKKGNDFIKIIKTDISKKEKEPILKKRATNIDIKNIEPQIDSTWNSKSQRDTYTPYTFKNYENQRDTCKFNSIESQKRTPNLNIKNIDPQDSTLNSKSQTLIYKINSESQKDTYKINTTESKKRANFIDLKNINQHQDSSCNSISQRNIYKVNTTESQKSVSSSSGSQRGQVEKLEVKIEKKIYFSNLNTENNHIKDKQINIFQSNNMKSYNVRTEIKEQKKKFLKKFSVLLIPDTSSPERKKNDTKEYFSMLKNVIFCLNVEFIRKL